MAEASRGMSAVQAVRELNSQGIGEAHRDDDPSPGIPSGKFKLKDILGAEAPSRYEGFFCKSRVSRKYSVPPRSLAQVVESSRMTAWGAQFQRMSTQINQVSKPVLMLQVYS
jgi:hypothetical protein